MAALTEALDVKAVANEVVASLAGHYQIPKFSSRPGGLTLSQERTLGLLAVGFMIGWSRRPYAPEAMIRRFCAESARFMLLEVWAMDIDTSALFAPIVINGHTVKNRLSAAPMTRISATQDGRATETMTR